MKNNTVDARTALAALVTQIERCCPIDELGQRFQNNVAYHKAREALGLPADVQEQRSVDEVALEILSYTRDGLPAPYVHSAALGLLGACEAVADYLNNPEKSPLSVRDAYDLLQSEIAKAETKA